MLTQTATCALVGNNRVHSPFQVHGPPLYGTSFITAAAHQLAGPGIALGSIKPGISHVNFFNGNVQQGIGWTDGAAPKAEMTGGLPGINLRSSGDKKIKSAPHLDTVENAHLGTLAALKTTGQKLLFRPCAGWSEKSFPISHFSPSSSVSLPPVFFSHRCFSSTCAQFPWIYSSRKEFGQTLFVYIPTINPEKRGPTPIGIIPFSRQLISILFFLPRILRMSTLVSRLPFSSISSSTVI